MTLVSWLIVIIPMIYVMWMGFYSKRYIRDITDYLACGRVAGRYVISVGDVMAGLSVITLVAACESNYQTGMAIYFWGGIQTPIFLFMALSGYCMYRFRETRCLSCGQFLEMRYSRSFRIVACAIRTLAEMVANAIGPAVAVRFFIYFMGIPHHFDLLGHTIPTYGLLVALLLIMALALIWPAGRISLLITDCLQGIISYPIFVVITVFVIVNVSWYGDVAPVMLDRPKGESFLNPMDVSELRDFNLFALIVTLMSGVLNRAAWIGNDTSGSGRTAHEQKMAGILGTWRNGFAYTMLGLIAIFVVTFMLGGRFSQESNQVRKDLAATIAGEVVDDPETRARVIAAVNQLPPAQHVIGVDKPYSRTDNPDTPFLDTVRSTMLASVKEGAAASGSSNVESSSKTAFKSEGEANAAFQEFKSLYNQMMAPVLLKSRFSPVLMGLFALLMLMLLLSTDDGRIFNASTTIVQDMMLPFMKKTPTVQEHLKLLKHTSLAVTIFFFIVSLFFAQLDYIGMFCTIMYGVWTGAAGPIMVGGLYTRFGTTAGAWASLVVGSGIPTVGLAIQRNWADAVYPWLVRHGYADSLGRFLETCSAPFNPYVVWTMDPVKCPVNSNEFMFFAMTLGVIAYIVVSWLTLKEPYNLDRMLHRGIYSDKESAVPEKEKFTFKGLIQKLVGIDHEYTKGDKIIAWSVFIYSLVWGFGIMFVGVLIWNAISPWSNQYWATFFFINSIVLALVIGLVSTVWFFIGGIIDTRRMFKDLKARVANPLDNGQVDGHVSLADKARFEALEQQKKQAEKDEEKVSV